jgi:hypothetical protein
MLASCDSVIEQEGSPDCECRLKNVLDKCGYMHANDHIHSKLGVRSGSLHIPTVDGRDVRERT